MAAPLFVFRVMPPLPPFDACLAELKLTLLSPSHVALLGRSFSTKGETTEQRVAFDATRLLVEGTPRFLASAFELELAPLRSEPASGLTLFVRDPNGPTISILSTLLAICAACVRDARAKAPAPLDPAMSSPVTPPRVRDWMLADAAGVRVGRFESRPITYGLTVACWPTEELFLSAAAPSMHTMGWTAAWRPGVAFDPGNGGGPHPLGFFAELPARAQTMAVDALTRRLADEGYRFSSASRLIAS